jgi:hypothetical protein
MRILVVIGMPIANGAAIDRAINVRVDDDRTAALHIAAAAGSQSHRYSCQARSEEQSFSRGFHGDTNFSRD